MRSYKKSSVSSAVSLAHAYGSAPTQHYGLNAS